MHLRKCKVHLRIPQVFQLRVCLLFEDSSNKVQLFPTVKLDVVREDRNYSHFLCLSCSTVVSVVLDMLSPRSC